MNSIRFVASVEGKANGKNAGRHCFGWVTELEKELY